MRNAFRFLLAFVVLVAITSPLLGQTSDLEARVGRLEHKVADTTSGATVWLYAAFCALWAQNTRRSALLWFILGLCFSVITVLVLLYKNSQDRKSIAAAA